MVLACRHQVSPGRSHPAAEKRLLIVQHQHTMVEGGSVPRCEANRKGMHRSDEQRHHKKHNNLTSIAPTRFAPSFAIPHLTITSHRWLWFSVHAVC
eukprot:6186133-Pleurochrysis_carterae.AAC.1